ncbi:hypothetical protein DY000_02060974 [Brassica cretica]|uniref:Uncharacterized protein n=1 Tax=Brassica cretica TaxID=69181 RepID=A0ABQ7AU36_BRACR|nr:hypothetical protein DY000_02060974 [Brassica cretica]
MKMMMTLKERKGLATRKIWSMRRMVLNLTRSSFAFEFGVFSFEFGVFSFEFDGLAEYLLCCRYTKRWQNGAMAMGAKLQPPRFVSPCAISNQALRTIRNTVYFYSNDPDVELCTKQIFARITKIPDSADGHKSLLTVVRGDYKSE